MISGGSLGFTSCKAVISFAAIEMLTGVLSANQRLLYVGTGILVVMCEKEGSIQNNIMEMQKASTSTSFLS